MRWRQPSSVWLRSLPAKTIRRHPPTEHTHSYSSWVIVDEPTCTEEGLRERTCSCGEKETETLEALGHTERAPVRENEKAPTCTAAGSYEEVITCLRCREEVSRKTVEVAALDHTPGEAVKENEVAATCTSAGSYEEVTYCTVCNAEASRKTVEVAALGHDHKGKETQRVTCISSGEMTYTCTRCGDSYKETIAPLGHDWGEMQPGTAATCTEKGYSDHRVCSRCGIDDGNTIPAKGHQGGTATCQAKAVCEVCGTPYGELGNHTPDKTDYIADEKGHWFACSLCGEELKGTTYAEHDYTGGEQNCKTCDVTDSQYFYFTLLDDGSSYGIMQKTTVLDEPDYTNEENPFLSFPAFTNAVKLPDYYQDLPITELTGMTVEITIENPGYDPITISNPCASFHFNTTLNSIELSNFITKIPESAFQGCSSLTRFNVPDSVTTIGYAAFRDCTSLAEIEIPDSVIAIGDYAFDSCALKEIKIPDSVTSIDDWAFEYCEEIVSIDISNVISIGKGIFRDCTALESVTLPDGITTIVDSMFWNCTSLIFEIPDTVTTIGDQAFIGCSFTSITIPDGVESIGGSTFADCTSLTSITIPESVTSIGDWAFRDCTSLTSITIPNSVTSIEDRAFWGCTSLTSITIPKSVTSIGEYAFEGCDNLTSVVFADTTSKWGMKRYSDYPVENTFTPSTPEANAKALTDTYLNRIWEKQTD